MSSITGRTRQIRDDTLAAYDAAVRARAAGPIHHFSEDGRLIDFQSGGPPIWAVAAAPVEGGTLYVTYGLSGALDPSREGHDIELSIRVPGDLQEWPALFLRAIAHDVRATRRQLSSTDVMFFAEAITRCFARPSERGGYPRCAMKDVLFTEDPALPEIEGPHGTTRVHRVVGLHADELRLLQRWSIPGFVQAMRERDPWLATDVARASLAGEPGFVEAIERGSREQGSAFDCAYLPGLDWRREPDGFRLELPRGKHLEHLQRMLRARLDFGRELVVMDSDPDKPRAVAFAPAARPGVRLQGDTLVIEVPDAASAIHQLRGLIVAS